MAEFAELALTGVPYITDNYEKVWDPAREKVLSPVRKKAQRNLRQVTRRFKNKQGDWEEYSDVESFSEDDGGPRSRGYTNGKRNSSRSRRGDVVEERRAYRATSTGRGDRNYARRRMYSR